MICKMTPTMIRIAPIVINPPPIALPSYFLPMSWLEPDFVWSFVEPVCRAGAEPCWPAAGMDLLPGVELRKLG